MSEQERRAYLLSMLARYGHAGRTLKGVMLDEYCANTGVGRKHAIACLQQMKRATEGPINRVEVATVPPNAARATRRGRPVRYAADASLVAALHAIWEAAKRPCSKRLVALLPHWLAHYELEVGTRLSRQTKRAINAISAATVDRLLAPTRTADRHRLHGLAGTSPASEWLRSLVPVRTHHHEVDRPGSLEADTVAHCGASIAGEFFWTLTCTDIHSGWTECASVWSKFAVGIKAAVMAVETRLPFALTAFDTDNGTEFINHTLQLYFATHRPPVNFTRSRPYEKNDQAYVEQKNYSVVRQFLGYQRLDNPDLGDTINTFFTGCWRDYVNFFLPTFKLIGKERVGNKTRRVYERIPQTPYQRILKSKGVGNNTKRALRLHYQTLNPFDLKRQIDDTLTQIFKLARYADL